MLLKASPKGYVNKSMMVDFGHGFVHTVHQKMEIEGPVILLLNGHYTHLFNWEFLNLMKTNGITVLAIPPHTSHLLQPLDCGPFHALKSWWNKELYKKIREVGGCKLTREEWFEVFIPAFECGTTVKNIQGGFLITGIYPLNRQIPIDEMKKKPSVNPDDFIDTASDSKIQNM